MRDGPPKSLGGCGSKSAGRLWQGRSSLPIRDQTCFPNCRWCERDSPYLSSLTYYHRNLPLLAFNRFIRFFWNPESWFDEAKRAGYLDVPLGISPLLLLAQLWSLGQIHAGPAARSSVRNSPFVIAFAMFLIDRWESLLRWTMHCRAELGFRGDFAQQGKEIRSVGRVAPARILPDCDLH